MIWNYRSKWGLVSCFTGKERGSDLPMVVEPGDGQVLLLNPNYRASSFSSCQAVPLVPRVLGFGVTYVIASDCVLLYSYGPTICKAKWYNPDRKLWAQGSPRVPGKGYWDARRVMWVSLSGTFHVLSHLTSPYCCSVLPQPLALAQALAPCAVLAYVVGSHCVIHWLPPPPPVLLTAMIVPHLAVGQSWGNPRYQGPGLTSRFNTMPSEAPTPTSEVVNNIRMWGGKSVPGNRRERRWGGSWRKGSEGRYSHPYSHHQHLDTASISLVSRKGREFGWEDRAGHHR